MRIILQSAASEPRKRPLREHLHDTQHCAWQAKRTLRSPGRCYMTGVTQSPVTRHVNVPWSKSRPCQRVSNAEQHADEQSPTSPRRNAAFQPRKGNLCGSASLPSVLRRRRERMFDAGLLVRSISAVIERTFTTAMLQISLQFTCNCFSCPPL